MRILMVSPHPVYAPRGTPISVFNRCAALAALGHEVDLVTYPVGEDRPVPGLHYLRGRRRRTRPVKVGPSWAKLTLNAGVAARTFGVLARHRRRYDVIHTHEEAGLIGLVAAAATGLPHVYDMGNDWSTVLQNYGLGPRHPLTRMAAGWERAVVRRASAVIAHFPSIQASIAAAGHPTPVIVVANVPLDGDSPSPPDPPAAGPPCVLYAGTLEPYQGVEQLVEAFAVVRREGVDARLVVVGGRGDQVAQLAGRAEALGIGADVRLEGPVVPEAVAGYVSAAAVLVSPRLRGDNTPLKIFSYLRAAKPILATRIPSHTQIVDERAAMLVEPTVDGLAAGLRRLLTDEPLRGSLAAGALALSSRYTPDHFVAGVARAYAAATGQPPSSDGDGLGARAVRAAAGESLPVVTTLPDKEFIQCS